MFNWTERPASARHPPLLETRAPGQCDTLPANLAPMAETWETMAGETWETDAKRMEVGAWRWAHGGGRHGRHGRQTWPLVAALGVGAVKSSRWTSLSCSDDRNGHVLEPMLDL